MPRLAAVQRPTADVIVPFKGSTEALERLCGRLGELALRPGDSVIVVDNTRHREGGPTQKGDAVRLVCADALATPAFARNAGAAAGTAEWLVFCDADAVAPADLLDRYFDPPPRPATALLGGGVTDHPAPPGAPPVARYAHLRGVMSQEATFDFGERWGYPKTANVACRRVAFNEIGGFRQEIRAAEDADLTYRLRAVGWEVERREAAAVVHASRTTLRGLIVQQALWGSGGAWVNRMYPGAVPLVGRPSLLRWAVGTTAGGFARAVRRRDRDTAIMAFLRPVEALAWELGRLLPNERPLTRASLWRRLAPWR